MGACCRLFVACLILAAFTVSCGDDTSMSHGDTLPHFWLTDPQRSIRFEEQSVGLSRGEAAGAATIRIDPGTTYQEIDGFGFALTGGSALHLHAMSPPARAALLRELFGQEGNAIGTSYLRLSIGASDLDAEVFSYDDVPDGETDPGMERFTLDRDRRHLIPVLKEILAINPAIKILASPWSPPTWMKNNRSSIGGSLRPEYYDAYAKYLVTYIQQMAAEGIVIDAITPQNEPLHPGNNPSLYMPARQQATFIGTALGPAFRAAGLSARIVAYDHNADRTDYPIAVLDDPEARVFVDGSAFHLYRGDISALSSVHDRHPDKNIYFTEQWVAAPGDLAADLRWHTRELIIGATRNWSRTVIEWNLAADQNQEPHTAGGCTQCLGAVTIEGDKVTRNPAYYVIAQAAKYVRPGSLRLASEAIAGLPNVAFVAPNGPLVVIVLNDGNEPATFNLTVGEANWHASLNAGAVGTFVLPID